MAIISEPKKRILLELKNGSKHGYEISKLTGLPMGSIYDHLAELLEGKFIEYKEEGRRKVYSLTKKGKALLAVIEDDDVI